MRGFLLLFFLTLALGAYTLICPKVWDNRENVRTDIPAGYVIPSKFSRILALGEYGVLSDFLFLKTMTFIGGRSVAEKPLDKDDWQFVIQSLNVITDLDPYFKDPYILTEGVLAWDAQKPNEANRLLRKGLKSRTWDWQLPFFIGFNEFYFLNNYDEASKYIMMAADVPGGPSFLPTLGARLAYYGGKSKTALLFLKEMLADANEPLLKKRLELRLLALERAVQLENAINAFKKQFGRLPSKGELVEKGFLDKMPVDPYGGNWIVLDNGRVFSTSKFSNSSK